MTSNLGRAHILMGVSAIAMLAGGASLAPAQAQDAAQAEDAELEEIVVTGSRIRRPELQAGSPVTVVDSEALSLSGNQTIEQTLNELPQVTPALTATTNNGGDGTATVNLRDLGTPRTLVLINGRRMIGSSTNGVVDVNNIPPSLIERVDVVTGGQSAVYGSDAVGGVVNFILKDNFQGLDFGGQYKISERGDGNTATASVTLGGNFADNRGNVVIHSSFTRRSAVFQGDRAFSRDALLDVGDSFLPIGSSRIRGGRTLPRTDEDGNLVPLVLPDGSTTTDNVKFTEEGVAIPREGETFNFAPPNFLQTPQERFLLSTLGHYDINDYITFYFEGMYSNTRVDQQLAFDANDIPDSGSLRVAFDNPAIPEVTRDFLFANYDDGIGPDEAAGDGIATLPFVGRRMIENGPRFEGRDFDLYRVVTGFEGDINPTWTYDLSFSFARVNRSFNLRNFTSDARIQQGLLNCPDGSTSGCVPVNIFGPGAVSEEAAAFISPDAAQTSLNEQKIIQGSVSGSLENFDLGAGPVGIALGGEYRDERAEFNPDAVIQTGELGPGNDAFPTRGSFDVWEIFGEAVIPILADMRGAERLDLELAARVSDYSTVGGVFTWKGGVQWAPISDVRFRAAFQQSIRAPNISELFSGRAAGAESTNDFCDASQLVGQPQSVFDFCQALGVPNPGVFRADPQSLTVNQGNPNLDEETADTWTLGAVIEPDDIPGLTATVDFYRIKVTNAITALQADTILDVCFDSMDPNGFFCQQITRRATGQITQILSTTENIASELREGVDWQINYERELPWGGTLGLRNSGNLTFTNEFISFPGATPTDCNGIFGGGCTGLGDPISPEWRVTQDVKYARGPWSVRLQNRLIGPVESATPEGRFQPRLGVNYYLDVTATYDVTDNIQVIAGVENLTDNKPPLIGFLQGVDANTDPQLFDVLLRSYFANVNVRF